MKLEANDYLEAIKASHEYIKMLNGVEQAIPSGIKGVIGELVVKYSLRIRDVGFQSKGGHAGCDLIVGTKRVEVRAHRPDGPYGSYGWKLKQRDKPVKYDLAICVPIDLESATSAAELVKGDIFVLTAGEVASMGEINLPRFRKVEKRITLFPDFTSFEKARAENPSIYTEFDERFNRTPSEYKIDNRLDLFAL